MSTPDKERDEAAAARKVRQHAWIEPSVMFLGDVKALVRGGGKSGPDSDSDPTTHRKTGVG